MRHFRAPMRFIGGTLLLVAGTIELTAAEGLTKPALLDSSSTTLAPAAPPKSATPPGAALSGGLSRFGSTSRQFQPPPLDPALNNQTRQALNFYGGYSARATLSQLPRRTPIQAAPPRPMQAQLKPFNVLQADSTLSPYLNLDRAETAEDLPNYFAFVRPQFQQMDTNRGQQHDLGRLQRQLNSVSATVVNPQQAGRPGLPGTGTPSRFMDTAQFYGGWRR